MAQTSTIDWDEIMEARRILFAPLPVDATEEEEAAHLEKMNALSSRPGRMWPHSKGIGEGGVRFEKEAWMWDDELKQLGLLPEEEEVTDEARTMVEVGDGSVPATPRIPVLRPIVKNEAKLQPRTAKSGEAGEPLSRNAISVDGNLALKPEAEEEPSAGTVIPFTQPSLSVVAPANPAYDKKRWKLSREKPGFLIRRIPGYDLTEDKYGVSYLYRLPRGKTTTDQGEHSGYLNWSALEAAGRLKKVGDPCTMPETK